MEITIYYGGEMPQRIKDALKNIVGMELQADFTEGENDIDSTAYGNYFGGDLKSDYEMREEMEKEGMEYEDKYSEGFFTMEDMGKTAAIFDLLCPTELKGDYKVTNHAKSEFRSEYLEAMTFFQGKGAYLLDSYR